MLAQTPLRAGRTGVIKAQSTLVIPTLLALSTDSCRSNVHSTIIFSTIELLVLFSILVKEEIIQDITPERDRRIAGSARG